MTADAGTTANTPRQHGAMEHSTRRAISTRCGSTGSGACARRWRSATSPASSSTTR